MHGATIIEFTPLPIESISWATTFSQFNIIRVFNWNTCTSSPVCSATHYNIVASNCGSCPTTTNHTIVTCTDTPTDGNMCTFAVQTVVCGNITGESSQVSLFNSNVPGQSTLTLHATCIKLGHDSNSRYIVIHCLLKWYRLIAMFIG